MFHLFRKTKLPKVRPARGKCPVCKVDERSWCLPNCPLLDPANVVRE